MHISHTKSKTALYLTPEVAAVVATGYSKGGSLDKVVDEIVETGLLFTLDGEGCYGSTSLTDLLGLEATPER